MKRILSLIMSIAVILSVSPLTFAEENYGENIALGKSVYSDTPYGSGFDGKCITDGDLMTDGAVADSPSGDVRNGWRNYMIVDLGETYELSRVIIRTRRQIDAAWARLGFMAVAANNPDFSDGVKLGSKDTAGEFMSDMNSRVNNVKARYVMVVNTVGYGHFAIAELEVYGDLYTGEGSGDFEDVTTQTQKNATKLLFNLGIMDGVDKTTFGSPMLITRAEAAELICKFARVSAGVNTDTIFNDVKADNPYSGYIKAGVDFGFISQAEMYRPDDYILDSEFLKMVLCINGYLMKPVTSEGYPQNIYSLASSTDLTKGTTGCLSGSYINRSDAAIVLYNALIGKSFEFKGEEYSESEETLLKKLYDCVLMRGIVTGNGASKLDEKREGVYLNTIELDNVEYSDQSGSGLSFLGEAVYFILDEDENVTGIWEDSTKTSKVKIYSEDIETASFGEIKTRIGDKLTRYKIDAHPYKIYNDVADSTVTTASLKPKNGYLTLVDNDKDGVYEIVKIYKPEILLVDSVNSDEISKKLLISGADGEKLTINYGNLSVIRNDGKATNSSKIKPGELIYAYISAGEELVRIQLQSSWQSGTVKSVGEEINISGTNYETTEYFREKFSSLGIGKDIKFYLDENNKVVYIVDDALLQKSEIMAVIQRFIVDDVEDFSNVKVYDSDKKFRELKITDTVAVDGKKKSVSQLAAMDSSYFEGKLAIIKISDTGEIRSIVTENDTNGELAPTNKNLANSYRANAGIYSGTTLVMPITDDVPVFTIPVDGQGRPHTSSDFTNLYNVTDLRMTYGVRTKFGSSGSEIGIYGANEFDEPTALLRKCVYTAQSAEYGAITGYLATDCMVFEKAVKSADPDGEVYYELSGYDILTGTKKTIELKKGLNKVINTFKIRNASWYSDEVPEEYMPDEATWLTELKLLEGYMVNQYFLMNIEELKKGDIIRYSNGSYANISELELIVENTPVTSAKCKVVYAAGDLPDTIMATVRMQYALAKEVKDGHIRFEATEGVDETLDLSFFDSNIIVVDGDIIESYPIASAGVCIDSGDRIVVYSNAGYHKSIVVYK